MKLVIITGSRDYVDSLRLIGPVLLGADMVMHGGAQGADAVAHQVAMAQGIPTLVVPAQWDMMGKKAGPLRNLEMVMLAKCLRLAGYEPECHGFPLPQSKGTYHCMRAMREAGIPTTEHKS